jgi:hypothetical protein
MSGSSCLAGRAPSGARRSRRSVCALRSVHISGLSRSASSRTYVPISTGRRRPSIAGKVRRINVLHGEWRSLVAHPAGGRAVAGSNPVSPINVKTGNRREHAGISAKTLGLVVGCSRLFSAVPGTRDRKRTAESPAAVPGGRRLARNRNPGVLGRADRPADLVRLPHADGRVSTPRSRKGQPLVSMPEYSEYSSRESYDGCACEQVMGHPEADHGDHGDQLETEHRLDDESAPSDQSFRRAVV